MAMERKQSDATMTRGTEGPVTKEEMQALIRNQPAVMPVKTWRPTTGGILSIVAGYLNILYGVLMFTGVAQFSGLVSFGFAGVGLGFGILLIVLGLISVIGGSYAIARRKWWMALAGSITTLFPSLIMFPGVLSLILITLGKPEFKK